MEELYVGLYAVAGGNGLEMIDYQHNLSFIKNLTYYYLSSFIEKFCGETSPESFHYNSIHPFKLLKIKDQKSIRLYFLNRFDDLGLIGSSLVHFT